MVSEALQDLLSKALRVFHDAQAPHAVIGGVAMNVWERIRATKDLDVIVFMPAAQFESIRNALRDAGFAHQRRIDHTELPDAIVDRFWLPVGDTGLSLKLDVVQGKLPFHADVLRRRAEVQAFGLTIPVASREDCILLKLLAGRPVDLVDAEELVRLHRTGLDSDYLTAAAGKLGLRSELAALLKSADTPPGAY